MNAMSDADNILTKALPLVEALRPIWSRMRQSAHAVRPIGTKGVCKKAPLNEAALTRHVSGSARCGGYLIDEGASTTKTGVYDFDSHDGATSWDEMRRIAMRLLDALERRGARPIPFRSSGGRGIHIYLLWEAPQDAYSVIQFMRSAREEAGLHGGAGGVAQGAVEIFPKQAAVAIGAYGNQVWLPLAGKSRPLDLFELDDLPLEHAIGMDWPVSPPVPVVENAIAVREPIAPTGDLARLHAALEHLSPGIVESIANEYQQWMNAMFAIHYESGGSEEGRSIAHAFCQRMSNYDADDLDSKWDTAIRHEPGKALRTGGWLYALAKEHGWAEDVAGSFDVVPAPSSAGGAEGIGLGVDLPKFERNKQGAILATLDNVIKAMGRPDVCGASLRFDEFRDEVAISYGGEDTWRPLRDVDYTRLRRHLETNTFKPVNKDLMREAVQVVADANRFDSAIEWLQGLSWDGVERVDRFIETYFSSEHTDYSRAVGAYLWTALAGRVLVPGCQADMVPVLVGAQGIKKSSIAAAMAPTRDCFTEIDLNERDADMSRRMRGVLVGEISELKGLHSRDMESIKAFITRRVEKWIPKFQEFGTSFARRLVFIGTTNKDEFLADPTGDRRWLPLRVNEGDVDALLRDRDQLWAEGMQRFLKNGVEWQDAERLAKQPHVEHTLKDPWIDVILAWAEQDETWSDDMEDSTCKKLRANVGFSTLEAMQDAMRMSAREMTTVTKSRIVDALKAAGFRNVTIRRGSGKPFKGWKR